MTETTRWITDDSLHDVLVDEKHDDRQRESDQVAGHGEEARERTVLVYVLYVIPVVIHFLPQYEVDGYVVDECWYFKHVEYAHHTLAQPDTHTHQSSLTR